MKLATTPLYRPMRWVASLMLALFAAACGGGGGGDAAGGGRTIGLDSNVAPNANMRCVDGPPAQDGNQLPNLFFPFAGLARSCTVLTFSPQDPGVPGPGVVTTASIRIGATTGRMRFVRLRNLYQNRLGTRDGSECCAVMEYGAIFTPTPNSVTTVALNFRMTWEAIPPPIDLTTVIGQDRIALEVLDPNTPIPGVWTQNGRPQLDTASFIWLPSVSDQGFPPGALQLPQRTSSFSGWLPTFSYNWLPG
jgi:hypothetical protein